MDLIIHENLNKVEAERISTWVEFLFHNLGKFGDPKDDILLAIKYALGDANSAGGFVLECLENDELIALAVLNRTGMIKYIPANILVYIAVSERARGRGVGKAMIEKIKENTRGGIALHVEPDNPAVNLYKALGFENKYLEMRYQHTD